MIPTEEMETVDSGTSSIMLAPGDCVPTTVALFQIKYKILTMAADASPWPWHSQSAVA